MMSLAAYRARRARGPLRQIMREASLSAGSLGVMSLEPEQSLVGIRLAVASSCR